MKTKWERFAEKHEFAMHFFGAGVVCHTLTWATILAINIVFWKLWSVSSYLLTERILIVVTISLGTLIYWAEKL